MSDNQEDDPVCTGCYGTGFNHYTERACTCEDGLKLKEEPPVVDDLIERTAALSAIRLGDTMTKLQSRIMALPAVDHPDNARLRAENERLRAALRDARECVETWAGYASEYFRDKHDLAGDLARIDAALAAQPAPGGKDE